MNKSVYGYIYLIVNNVNGKTYVGQKKLYNKSWNKDGYMGSGTVLEFAKNKYGIENFEKFLICFCNSKEELDEQEIFWIAEYKNRGKAEYNLTKGGHSFSDARIGKHRSEETKKKISEKMKGGNSTSWKKGHNGYWKGKHRSEETKKKISEARKGKKREPLSEETKKKMSEAHKGKHYRRK